MNNLAISRSHPLNRSIAFTAKMLALVTSMLAFTADNNNLMKLRGGMSLGPITPGNFDGGLKVAAAVTAASAVAGKYADIGDTTIGSAMSGGAFDTNLIISLATGAAGTVVYSVSGSAFDAAKLTATLWLASVVIKLKDSNWDFGSLKDEPVEKLVAATAAYLAFA